MIGRKTGECLVSLQIDESVDESLVGGLFSAIHSFGTESFNAETTNISIEIENARVESVTFNEDDIDLIGIGLVDDEISSRDFRMFVNSVLTDMVEAHERDLLEWDGEISKFSPFKERLKEQIRHTFEEGVAFDDKMDDIFNKMIEGDFSGLDEF